MIQLFKRNISIGVLAFLISVMFTYSCKKYNDPAAVFEDATSPIKPNRRVMVISIDGVTGSEIKTIAPPNIAELRKTAKYSYNVFNSTVANDAASWVSMITGVSYSKHKIKTDNFVPAFDDLDSHGSSVVYRSGIDYIVQLKALKTAVITPWSNLRGYLKIADFSPIVTSDEQVKDSTINILNNVNQLGATVVNFKSAQMAGEQGGFNASNDNYKNAILQVDGYIGEIVQAIKNRKNYSTEDWLIIVTTDHGGSNADPKMGFMVVSNKNLKEEELKKTGFNTVLFTGTGITASVPEDNGLYDPGKDKSFTVQMQVKFNTPARYPGFLSKGTALLGQSITGWMYLEDNASAAFALGGTLNGGAGKTQVNAGSNVGDLSWHTITTTVKYVNSTTRTVTTFVDGVQIATGNISANGNLSTTEKLTIGYKNVDGGGSGLSFQAADLCYFNTALDAQTILANKNLKDITQHPNYANLVGYWPIDEGFGSILYNKAPNGYNMELKGNYTWKSMKEDVPTSVTPDPQANQRSTILSIESVTSTMLYWMGIKILPAYGIDGNPFLDQFEVEFLK